MPKVALNGRFSGTPQPTGTQTAAFQLFDAIVREPGRMDLTVFADERFSGVKEWKDFSGLEFVNVPFQDWGRARAHWWEQVELPVLAKKRGCAVTHHPITTCPVWQNGNQNVVTLHDLNFYRHPEWYSHSFRFVYALCAIPGLKRASRVVTISQYVRDQAEESFSIPADRLRMIYNGVKSMATSVVGGVTAPYLLCVGSLQPHKNLVRMIKAYLKLRPEYPELELRVVGRPQPRFTAEDELPGLLKSPGVNLLGYLSENDLATAYAGAAAFCYPSLEEGFGLPVLEAMTLGTPVLTSNVSCLPEVSGPSAFYVDPLSVEAIASGIRQILSCSEVERAGVIDRGKTWATKFSWQAAARSYLEVYKELL